MFQFATLRFTVAVPPAYLNGLELLAAEEALDSKILKYDERLDGVVIAYQDLKYDQDAAGVCQDEQPDCLFRYKCKVLLYAPKQGQRFKAIVSDIKSGHMTLLAAGVFQVVVRSTEFPADAVLKEHSDGTKYLMNKKTKEPIVSVGEEYVLRCLKISHHAGALNVEASFNIEE